MMFLNVFTRFYLRFKKASIPLFMRAGLGTCLCLLSSFLLAEDAAKGLYDRIKGIETVDSQFTQRVVDGDTLIQEASGEFSLRRPNYVYWRTLPPYEQEIVGDGSILWVFDPDLEQVTQYNDGDLLQGPMALFSESLDVIRARYQVAEQSVDEQRTRYALSPTSEEESGAFNEVVFEFQNDELAKIEIRDRLNQLTEISLSSRRFNSDLPTSRFQFVPPSGVDIIVNE